MNFNQRKFFIAAIIIALAIGFSGGVLITYPKSNSTSIIQHVFNTDKGKPANVDFSLFWQVWNDLNDKFVNPGNLDMQKMLYGAIQGMVNSAGDPYTVFFEPSESKSFQEEISGSFEGVGMEIGKRNNILTVIAPIKDTPAFRAGIQAGDKILKIDSKTTADMSIEEAVSLIKGRKGTKVVLTINTKSGETKDVSITRDSIKIPTVDWQLLDDGGKKIAYVQIYAFNQNVDSEFSKAAEGILKSDAQGIIIDLRNNPGGLLDSAINLSGWFLDKGQPVVSEVFRDGSSNQFTSDGNAALKTYPTVILVNGGSASASEIMSGALHDDRKIKLIGEKTFGKGSVQQLENFGDGSSLKITIAKWLTPNGISISEKGIEPDVTVTIPQKDIDSGDFVLGTPGKDQQLDKALNVLK